MNFKGLTDRWTNRNSIWLNEIVGISVIAALALGLIIAGPVSAGDLVKAGTVTVEQYQVAFIGSGNLGGGELLFKGRKYKFTIGGLGIGGFGVSKIEATGEVYNMPDVASFEGTYGQARYGAVVGTASTGELWLQNTSGVVIHLVAQRKGVALSLGGDAVYIGMD